MKIFQQFQTEVYYILEKYEPFPHEKVVNKIKSKEKEARNVFNKTLNSCKELKAIRNRPADPGRIGSNRYWELRDAHKANPGVVRLKQKFENERKKLREIQKQDEKANEYHIPNVERSNRRLKKTASQIKKMKKAMNRHDPVENRFRELENKNKGDIKLK